MKTPSSLAAFLLAITWTGITLAETAPAVSSLAQSQVAGTTYTIANGFTEGTHPVGSHFHSSNLSILPPGNPSIILPAAAGVGGFFGDEEVRGISEFPVGETEVVSAVLSFDVLDLFEAGLSPDPNGVGGLYGQDPLEGFVDVFPYAADFLENVGDYQAPPISETPLLSIEVADGLVFGGDTFSVDVTSFYNELRVSGEELGIRLQMADPDLDAGAITFHNFRLDLEVVPEPTSALPLLIGLVACMRLRQQRLA